MAISKEKLIEFLEKKIEELKTPHDNDNVKWISSIQRILAQIYGKESKYVEQFNEVLQINGWANPAENFLQGIVEEVQNFGILKKEEMQKESPQTFNITQNQSVNITIENALQNTLTVTQHKELETILAEKDTEKKSNKLVEFLKSVGEKALIEIIKSQLI